MMRKLLTPGELEVLELAPKGFTNREIGSALNLKEQTVKNHLHSIYLKIGAENRAEAVYIAMKRGLIS